MPLEDISILIVEDDFSFALELEMLVKEIGYQVAAIADNSAEALEAIFADKPDLILMDIDIKGKFSGIEVAEQVKHLHIPILFITNLRQEAIYERAKNTNFIGYMVKPLASFSLKSAIELAVKQLNHKQSIETTTAISVQKDLFFKKNGIFKKIDISQINYIEANGNYSVTITNTDKLMTSLTLTELEKILSPELFIRIHRGYWHLSKIRKSR
ncbi:MAG: LytR/AlgR family response regulator transcription factor [Saprospiraceae bacterium]